MLSNDFNVVNIGVHNHEKVFEKFERLKLKSEIKERAKKTKEAPI
jgi:hypothetical protein